jgi:hypothetical protein
MCPMFGTSGACGGSNSNVWTHQHAFGATCCNRKYESCYAKSISTSMAPPVLPYVHLARAGMAGTERWQARQLFRQGIGWPPSCCSLDFSAQHAVCGISQCSTQLGRGGSTNSVQSACWHAPCNILLCMVQLRGQRARLRQQCKWVAIC